MERLTRDKLNSISKIKVTEVDMTDYWGGIVWVKSLNGLERYNLEERFTKDPKNAASIVVQMCLCDEQGNLLYSENEVNEVAQLEGAALVKLFAHASKINKLTPDDIEDQRKN